MSTAEAGSRMEAQPDTQLEAHPEAQLEAQLEAIVRSVLYEGYVLYPYRPDAAKNRVRWTFGGIHPPSYAEMTGGTEPADARVTCLLEGGDDTEVDIRLGFLQPLTRLVRRVAPPVAAYDPSSPPDSEPVDSLTVAGEIHRSWEEAVEERVELATTTAGALSREGAAVELGLPAQAATEALVERGLVVGLETRSRLPLRATVEVRAVAACDRLWRVTVDVRNLTDFDCTGSGDRARAMLQALVSAHLVLRCRGEGARWLSLADPPSHAAEAAAECERRGLWPLLVDAADSTVLASPIILEDHPEVAPESPGDLFDSAEIDEILTLRIMTLTDEEKAEMRAADARTRAMLERTESMDDDTMLRLHGTLRSPGRFGDGDPLGGFDQSGDPRLRR